MKNAVLMLVLALALVGLTGEALAQSSASISVTVELATEISIAITAGGTWPVGSIAIDDVVVMGSPSTVENQGNVAVDLDIDVDYPVPPDANGWTAGTVGPDDVFQVDVTETVLPISLTTTPQDLVDNLAVSVSQDITATYTAPAGDTVGGGESHDFSIVVAATESP